LAEGHDHNKSAMSADLLSVLSASVCVRLRLIKKRFSLMLRVIYIISILFLWCSSQTDASPSEAIYTVRGTSLSPLVRPNQEIRLILGFYDQNPVQREDIIAYAPAHADAPIIKIVKAIEGDRWEVKTDADSKCCMVYVNGTLLKNSQGHAYQFPLNRQKMLDLYAKHYPVLPEDTYFVLGDRTTGTLDSAKFGLIHKRNIIGKVEKVPGSKVPGSKVSNR
jgi:signal peptidase I